MLDNYKSMLLLFVACKITQIIIFYWAIESHNKKILENAWNHNDI